MTTEVGSRPADPMIGRLAHAHGFGQEPETTNYRTRGMQLTFAVLIVGALTNIVVAFQ